MSSAAAQLLEQAWSLLAVAQSFPVLTAVVLVVLASLWLCSGGGAAGPDQPEEGTGWREASADFLRRLGAPEHPHLEGTFVPSEGQLVLNNHHETFPIRNDHVDGKFLTLHRATYNKELNKSGDYAFGRYFLGKKRLWEARVQLQFKHKLSTADMFFGISLEGYVPMNKATKSSMEILVATLKRAVGSAVGSQIYHSPGDDPKRVAGAQELELPVFVMPLLAFDQFIVTPAGETPPELTSTSLGGMGSCRFKRIREFRKDLEQLKLEPGPTYTFCFWGISPYLDQILWKVIMPIGMGKVDFNQFCGRPPVHVVMYYLSTAPGQEREKRHLESRKNYVLNLAFWSSERRPAWERVSSILTPNGTSDESRDSVALEGKADTRTSVVGGGGPWMCCGKR